MGLQNFKMGRVSELQQKKKNFISINNRLVVLNALLLLAFFASQILITSLVGTKSQEIDQIRSEKNELRSENKIVSAEIDRLKSFAAAEEIINKYHLQAKDVIFLEESDLNGLALDLSENERR